MTEQTLEKAIEIKRKIDRLRGRKAELEKVQVWCKEEDVNFRIQAYQGGCCRDSAIISGVIAELVLDKECEDIENEVEILLNELSDLH